MTVQRLFPNHGAIKDSIPSDFVGFDQAKKQSASLELVTGALVELANCDRETDEWETLHIAAALGSLSAGMYGNAVNYALKATMPADARLPQFAGARDMPNGTLLQLQNGLQAVGRIEYLV